MYSMKEMCEKTGLSYETLKFYCNQGLIPDVRRDAQNRRVFEEHHVGWVHGLLCLRRCGMGLSEMKEYLDLLAKGKGSIPQLKEILARKREELERARSEIEESLRFIDWKQQFYDDVTAGKLPDWTEPPPDKEHP